MKHVPAWVPGAGFKRKAREWRALSLAMLERPFEMVRRNMVRVHARVLHEGGADALVVGGAGGGDGGAVMGPITAMARRAPTARRHLTAQNAASPAARLFEHGAHPPLPTAKAVQFTSSAALRRFDADS